MKFEDYDIVRHGRIIEFNESNQTATVRVCSEKVTATKLETESTAGLIDIKNVPVQVSSGGGWAMTLPFKKGDTCIMLFSQSGYDHWLFDDKDSAGRDEDGTLPYWTKRVFSEADALCIAGFNTLPRAIENYSTDGSEWRNGNASQSIHLKGDGTIDIKTTANVNITCTEAKVTASKTTIDGEVLVSGDAVMQSDLIVQGDMTCMKNVTAQGVTAQGAIAGQSISVAGKDVGSHTHTSNGDGATTSPPN